MDYSGAQGTLIHEKKLRSKISCQTPFKLELIVRSFTEETMHSHGSFVGFGSTPPLPSAIIGKRLPATQGEEGLRER